jgi:hypothetical protein
MPVKKRIDKRREIVISERAVAIFHEMRVAARQCACESSSACLACRWGDLHSELHNELYLPPWIWPCLRHTLGDCSDRRFVGLHKSWVSQRELWLLLREAERAAKRSAQSRLLAGNGHGDALEEGGEAHVDG